MENTCKINQSVNTQLLYAAPIPIHSINTYVNYV